MNNNIKFKTIIEFLQWKNYEHDEWQYQEETTIQELKDSTRIYDQKLATLLEEMGFKTINEMLEWKEKK